MKSLLIKNALLINEGKSREASVLVVGDTISTVYTDDSYTDIEEHVDEIIDASGKWLLPGVIDDQVHFREPGLTHKADINTESMAAVAGGVTSYMEMPNTKPPTTTREALEWKFSRAAQTSLANYSFYIGATNDNIDEVLKADYRRVCGIKVFMGSSTGNMLVDSPEALARIFAEAPTLIATHCEKEEIIKANKEKYIEKFGKDLSVIYHPLIRSAEACYASSSEAVELAHRYNARLHLLHLSTAKELSLLSDGPVEEKQITAEVCVHHLYFDDNEGYRLGTDRCRGDRSCSASFGRKTGLVPRSRFGWPFGAAFFASDARKIITGRNSCRDGCRTYVSCTGPIVRYRSQRVYSSRLLCRYGTGRSEKVLYRYSREYSDEMLLVAVYESYVSRYDR